MAKVALLIGVSEYEPGLNPLPAAVKDVEAMEQVLLHPEMGGFTETDIMVLKNPQRQDMEEAIENLFVHRQKDDLLVLFFSGHGIKDDTGRLFLATRTTRKTPRGDLIRSSAVAASVVHESMSRSRSKRQVVILDSCFSGAFAEGLSAKDDGTINIREQLGGEGRAVLTSSSSTQYSFEQQGSDLSIYTRYLIEGITTGAADLDEDGVVSIDELHEYASRKVREMQPTMRPEIYTSREGFKIRLTKVPQGDPKQKYRKEVARYSNRGDVSFVGRKILDALRNRLGISEIEATAIEDEMLAVARQEFREKLQRYERDFSEALQQQVALSEDDINLLRLNLQQILGLRNEDTMPIEVQVTARIQLYKQHLQEYRQSLAKAMRQEYPLSQLTRHQLQQMQQEWQLQNEDLAAIENSLIAEVEAYRQKLQQFEQAFTKAVQQEYPLSEAKHNQLWQQQQLLGLKAEDIQPITARITAGIETYRQKLQQYEQIFIRATQQQYPLSTAQLNQLRQQQQILALKNEDIASIETRITAEIEAYLQKLQQYEQIFIRATQQQYPLSTAQLNQLRQEQQLLGLKNENIAPIENRIKAEIEAYLQKLQHYEQALIQTIQHEYPFSEEIREELRRYQRVLELGDEEVAQIEEKLVRQRAVNKPQIQQSNTYQQPVVQSHSIDTNAFLVEEANSDELPTQFLSRPLTQAIPDTERGKTHKLPPLKWIIPLIFVVAAGALGLLVKELRSPFSFPNPTIEATPVVRSLANLSPGWVIKTTNQISLGNNQSLPTEAFLEVIETKPNPKPASGNFSVSMRVCSNKSTQSQANTNELKVLLDLSQLKRYDVFVLQSDAPSPCKTVTQPPASPPSDTSPT